MITDYSSSSHHKLWLLDARTNIRDVFEMRKMIDIEAAALAAKRSTPEDLKKISETLVDTIEFQEMIASDMSFHRAIVKATHNEIIFKVYNSVTAMLFQVYNYYSFLPEEETEKIEYVKEIYVEHKKILKAIESGKAGLAVESMREHFEFVEKKLLSNVSRNI
jgi:GntR family transcriptional repressor for pyruvate dehydrogenase complex